MPRKARKFAVGDRVRYTADFLRSTGMFTGAIPQARGTITTLEPFGEAVLATIDWGNVDVPPRVITANLEPAR
jgi:hypothetical protein